MDALNKYNSTSYTSYLTLNRKANAKHDRDRFRAGLLLNKKCKCGNVRPLGADVCKDCAANA